MSGGGCVSWGPDFFSKNEGAKGSASSIAFEKNIGIYVCVYKMYCLPLLGMGSITSVVLSEGSSI